MLSRSLSCALLSAKRISTKTMHLRICWIFMHKANWARFLGSSLNALGRCHLGLDDSCRPVAGRQASCARCTLTPPRPICRMTFCARLTGRPWRSAWRRARLFLDHRVAELAWQLPLNMKIRGGQGKWALRQVLYRHVPRDLIERPKAGFGIPVGQWLRGPLRQWAESLLDEKRLQAEGYFFPAPIRQRWAEHVNGQRDHTASLWAVLMFQAWLRSQ